MKDIADHVGVSKNTVSLALRNLPGVSKKTRDKIRETAIQLNYAGFGRLEQDAETAVIVLVPEVIHADNHFYHPVILGMEQYGSSQGISVVIRTLTEEQEHGVKLPNLHSGMRASGVIAVGNICREYTEALLERRIPVVLVDNAHIGLHADCVLSDIRACRLFSALCRATARCSSTASFKTPSSLS